MAWQQISLITDEQTAPMIADWFSDRGAISVTFMDAEDEPVYEPALGETKIWSRTQVIALFESEHKIENLHEELAMNIQAPLHDWRLEDIADQAWERAWMDYYRPMKFGERLWVCPTGQEQTEPGTVCLTLDPGLAFGTGTHPTTALCLEWLAGQDLINKRVIDYGCGSGILAIAAVLLGAERAYAVDIDPQALTATQANADKNGIAERIDCFLPDHFTGPVSDVLIANILAKPLAELSSQLRTYLVSGGDLALSGVLQEQGETVAAAYRPWADLNPPAGQGEWLRLDGSKR
jgi:ribosomal protein L11 methyltransferase